MSELERLRAPGEVKWYRGHTNYKWTLTPSVARRREHLENELTMLKRFRQDAGPRLRDRPSDDWEWLFLAQHFGVPTRLLDWTENPLVGLWFAVAQDDDV